jgi:hypothetical protein
MALIFRNGEYRLRFDHAPTDFATLNHMARIIRFPCPVTPRQMMDRQPRRRAQAAWLAR